MLNQNHLHILWTNDNQHTSQFMVFFYATQSMVHRHWDEVTVILWGAPVKTITENKILQEEMNLARLAGVRFSACTSCANKFGVTDLLRELGVEIFAWTQPFTQLVKQNAPIVYA